ncbi:DUF389 domain-containing protein [Kordiimonas sediminis]|uniref:DUF389 domain-containing protein n=1 Tax=Kordiimonas sediminis TaxID=1735581 RepID=A0A919E7I7_9PROT|nr:TIGR00341 family protein [Kordiimonas sediminis]GHF21161.1 DUF389 domain-containing protein [Kordiimonas sediminis]
MPLKMLQISAPVAAEAKLKQLAREYECLSFHKGVTLEDDHAMFFILTTPKRRQKLIDKLQEILSYSSQTRISIMPVDATLPAPDARGAADTREELMHKMDIGANTDGTFLTLAALSTVVALIGLMQDNVAVVVGAMVIAPLLGPNLAFAFGTSLGDTSLMRRALVTALNGLIMSIIFASLTGYIWGEVPESIELMSRTYVGLDGVILAAASGVAGVLSLTSGLSMTLVGVMVAVALLPPAATFGFMLGVGELGLAFGAFKLLAVNIVSVNLAGLLVFLAKGFRPRLWFERRMARSYVLTGIVFWSLCLLVLVGLIRQ